MGLGDLLRRGAAAGAAAGTLAAVWLLLVTERPLRDALKIEDARAAYEDKISAANGAPRMPEPELVTHPQQVVFAVLTMIVVGALVGLVFAIVYGAARRRLPGYHDYTKSFALAAIEFGAVTLFPFLAIPGMPPAVGNPATVNERTLIYLGAIALGVTIALAAFAIDKALAARVSTATRLPLVFAFVAVAAVGLLLALPNTPDAIQDPAWAFNGELSYNASPELIWRFRTASLGIHVILWSVIGLGFGALAEHSLAGRAGRTVTARPATR